MDHSNSVASLTLSDRLSALPDDILGHMLSYLTLCDSARARLLSPRWRYLSDNRSVLHFDARNMLRVLRPDVVFYMMYYRESLDLSKFVKLVDKFLEIWKDRKFTTLKVDFFLGNKQASHIDRWVERGINTGIETLELELKPFKSEEKYVLSDQLFHCGNAFYLKHLRLRHCGLTFSCDCASWISHLSSLDLGNLTLHEKDIDCIMSVGVNLTSLTLLLKHSPIAFAINVELPRLKKLEIYGNFRLIELNSPNLESFKFSNGEDRCKFSHVPLLKKVIVNVPGDSNCSFIFDKLARHVPNLLALDIRENAEVDVQPLPSNGTISRLKWLSLDFQPPGSDLLSITYLLNASPFLEILQLTSFKLDFPDQNPRREYIDCPHFHLKEVKIHGFRAWNFIELARYLLNNGVALEQVVIADDCFCSRTRYETSSLKCPLRLEARAYDTSYCFEKLTTNYCALRREEMITSLLENRKTNAELVFKTKLGVVLNASNRTGSRVHLVYPES